MVVGLVLGVMGFGWIIGEYEAGGREIGFEIGLAIAGGVLFAIGALILGSALLFYRPRR